MNSVRVDATRTPHAISIDVGRFVKDDRAQGVGRMLSSMATRTLLA